MLTLSLQRLSAGYGRAEVLHEVSLDVQPGAVVGIIGPNGAGKTTLLRAVAGLADLQQGDLLFRTRDLRELQTHERARLGVVLVPERGNLFTSLTVAEHIAMCSARARPGAAIGSGPFEYFPDLRDLRARRGRELSGGQRQMLAIASALAMRPDLLMLDEPSAGLAPRLAHDVLAKVGEALRALGGLIVVEQNLSVLREIVDVVYVLRDGRIVAKFENPSDVGDDELMSAYLAEDVADNPTWCGKQGAIGVE